MDDLPSNRVSDQDQSAPTDPLQVHSEALVADLHCDTVLQMQRGYDIGCRHQNYHVDIPRLRDGGVDLVVMATTVNPYNTAETPFLQVNRQLDVITRAVEKNKVDLVLCLNGDAAVQAKKHGKIGVILAVEGGHALEQDPAKLERLHHKGVRLLTIVHEQPTGWAVGWNETNENINGLTDLGREMIAELNRLGIIIDLSHSSPATGDAVAECSRQPVVASHSCAYALCPHGRNVLDEQAKKIVASGGIIGVSFVSLFVSPEFGRVSTDFRQRHAAATRKVDALFVSEMNEDDKVGESEPFRPLLDEFAGLVAAVHPTVADIANHIDYFVNRLGIEHVAVGSDFDGMMFPPRGLENCSRLPNLTRELVRRGYRESHIRKILGGNFLKVFRQVCG